MRIRVIPKTLFFFDGRANSTQIITIRNAIELSDYFSGVLIVRTHAKAGMTGTASAEVALVHVSITPEEPHSFFDPLGSVPDLAKVTIANADPNGTVYHQPFAVSPGTQSKLVLRWIQGGTAAAGNQTLGIGIDIAARQS